MKRIILWFRAIFGFNQKEINGFIILSLLMAMLIAAPFFYPLIFEKEKYNSSSDEKKLQELLVQIKKKEPIKEKNKKSKWIPNKYKKKNFEKGKKHHIIKNENEQIDDGKKKWKKNIYKKKEIVPIQINTADTIELRQIKGIGKKNSKWIIRERDKFGGFYSIYQLAEVYSLDSEFVKKNEQFFLQPDLSFIRKININTASVKEMVRHPYLEYKQTIAIANYRDQHGNFKSFEDLLKIHLITENDIEKLKYYLAFDKE